MFSVTLFQDFNIFHNQLFLISAPPFIPLQTHSSQGHHLQLFLYTQLDTAWRPWGGRQKFRSLDQWQRQVAHQGTSEPDRRGQKMKSFWDIPSAKQLPWAVPYKYPLLSFERKIKRFWKHTLMYTCKIGRELRCKPKELTKWNLFALTLDIACAFIFCDFTSSSNSSPQFSSSRV